MEVREAASIVEEIADPDARIIRWMTIDEDYTDDEIKITIIATWFVGENHEWPSKSAVRDRSGRKLKTGGEDFVGRMMKDEGMSRDSKLMWSMMSNNQNNSSNNSNGYNSGGFNSHSMWWGNNNQSGQNNPFGGHQESNKWEDMDTPAFMRRKLS
jgi:hypothetical protein